MKAAPFMSAMRCNLGFCTPGMLVAARDILRRISPARGKHQFTFWALRTKAASSALKRGASSKNGAWPMP